MHWHWSPFALLMIIGPGVADRTVTVIAGANPRPAAPVHVATNVDWSGQAVSLVGPHGDVTPAQADVIDGKPALTWIQPSLPAYGKVQYNLRAASSANKLTDIGVTFDRDDHGIAVKIDGQLVTRYVAKGGRKPSLYPVLGPDGQELTQSGPSDHIHHRSFWFTHGKVNGHDFWSEAARSGKTVATGTKIVLSGPLFGEFTSTTDWLAKDGGKVCTDERRFRFYRVPDARIFDVEIAVTGGDKELVFGDDKEGAFGCRVAKSMSVDQGKGKPRAGTLINARGEQNDDAWGKQSPWCDYYGPAGGKVAGIAIFDHPKNFCHPTYWHIRTYGLFCANPFGKSFFTKDKTQDGTARIPPGSALRLRYRVYLHRGDTKTAQVAEHFAAYAEPLKVTLE